MAVVNVETTPALFTLNSEQSLRCKEFLVNRKFIYKTKEYDFSFSQWALLLKARLVAKGVFLKGGGVYKILTGNPAPLSDLDILFEIDPPANWRKVEEQFLATFMETTGIDCSDGREARKLVQDSQNSFALQRLPMLYNNQNLPLDVFIHVKSMNSCFSSADAIQIRIDRALESDMIPFGLRAVDGYDIGTALSAIEKRQFFVQPERVKTIRNGMLGYCRLLTRGFIPKNKEIERRFWQARSQQDSQFDSYLTLHYPNQPQGSLIYCLNYYGILERWGEDTLPLLRKIAECLSVSPTEELLSHLRWYLYSNAQPFDHKVDNKTMILVPVGAPSYAYAYMSSPSKTDIPPSLLSAFEIMFPPKPALPPLKTEMKSSPPPPLPAIPAPIIPESPEQFLANLCKSPVSVARTHLRTHSNKTLLESLYAHFGDLLFYEDPVLYPSAIRSYILHSSSKEISALYSRLEPFLLNHPEGGSLLLLFLPHIPLRSLSPWVPTLQKLPPDPSLLEHLAKNVRSLHSHPSLLAYFQQEAPRLINPPQVVRDVDRQLKAPKKLTPQEQLSQLPPDALFPFLQTHLKNKTLSLNEILKTNMIANLAEREDGLSALQKITTLCLNYAKNQEPWGSYAIQANLLEPLRAQYARLLPSTNFSLSLFSSFMENAQKTHLKIPKRFFLKPLREVIFKTFELFRKNLAPTEASESPWHRFLDQDACKDVDAFFSLFEN